MYTSLEPVRSLFLRNSEQFQTRFTVYNFNKMYTGTFFLPAVKNWINNPLRNPFTILLLTTNLKSILLVEDLQSLELNSLMMPLKTL